jgi:hypothetical protein
MAEAVDVPVVAVYDPVVHAPQLTPAEQRRLQLESIQALSRGLANLTLDELDQRLREPFTSSDSQSPAFYSESAEYRVAISSIRFEKPAIWKNYIHSFDQNEITSLYVTFQYTSSFSLLKFLAFLCSCVDHSTKPLELTLAISSVKDPDSDRSLEFGSAIDSTTVRLVNLLDGREQLSLTLNARGGDADMEQDNVDAMVTALTMFMLRRNREVDTFAFHRPVKSWIRAIREACKANPVQQWQPTLHLEAKGKVILSVLASLFTAMSTVMPTEITPTLRCLSLDFINPSYKWGDDLDDRSRFLTELVGYVRALQPRLMLKLHASNLVLQDPFKIFLTGDYDE